ncbi:hypothetical protein QI724_004520 [Vibrio parahaemolyticus]|nr:hypothetical protein [Vibrio parahaemolyticus]
MNIESIASMIVEPFFSRDMIVERIKDDWKPKDGTKSLYDVISDVRDDYSRNIATELAYDKARKLQAVEVLLTVALETS